MGIVRKKAAFLREAEEGVIKSEHPEGGRRRSPHGAADPEGVNEFDIASSMTGSAGRRHPPGPRGGG